MTAVQGGNEQLNSYGDTNQYVVGREYLSHFHKKLMARLPSVMRFAGDSSTFGTSVDQAFQIPALLQQMALQEGHYNVTAYNAGVSEITTTDWIAGTLKADIAANPDLYIIRFGINDAGRLTVSQFISNIRTGLALIRASKTLAQMSVILEMPNSTSDTPNRRDEKFYEAIKPGLLQAARDYHAAFVDTYAYLRDSRVSSDWMDSLFPVNAGSFVVGRQYEILTHGTTDFTAIGAATNNVSQIFTATGVGSGSGTATAAQHIHPLDVMNLWIASLLGDVIFPKGLLLNGASDNRLINPAGMQITKAVDDAISSYPFGISIYRATPGGSGSMWPYDGAVVTINQADGIQFQYNFSYKTGLSMYAFRLGQNGTWLNWSYVPELGLGGTPTIASGFGTSPSVLQHKGSSAVK